MLVKINLKEEWMNEKKKIKKIKKIKIIIILKKKKIKD